MANARATYEVETSSSGSRSPGVHLRAAFRRSHFHPERNFALQVEFEARPGFTILFGASGAGKTTLLDAVAGLSTPDAGQIKLGERTLFDAEAGIRVSVAERRIGYVFQSLALFPHMTVEQNVAYGLFPLPKSERAPRVDAVLEAFRIAPLARRNVRAISGGERQRTALARTLVTDPELLLLDEPLAALDAPTKGQIIRDLRAWNHAHQIPILYVTHSREEVFSLGERVLMIDSGRIVAEGTPHEVMMAPVQETAAQLIGFENVFDAVVEAVRPERGTMNCRIGEPGATLVLETPLVGGGAGAALRIGIRAGDILLATSPPAGISARNILPGRIQSIEQRDVIAVAQVRCRVAMEVHLTLAARDALELAPGKEVWLVIKTHSCHLMQRETVRP
jgi:molybdate transport system ATP-binding protein